MHVLKWGSGAAVPLISEAMDEQYLAQIPLNLAIYNHEFTAHCTSVPAYQAVYGGWAINVGDNRFPWSSRAERMQENWVDMQRAFLSQGFVEGSVLGWMALEELAMWMTNASHAQDIGFFGALALVAFFLLAPKPAIAVVARQVMVPCGACRPCGAQSRGRGIGTGGGG